MILFYIYRQLVSATLRDLNTKTFHLYTYYTLTKPTTQPSFGSVNHMTARLLNSRYLSLLRVGNLTHPKHGRAFNAASRLMENHPIVTLPARKPIGAVRGG